MFQGWFLILNVFFFITLVGRKLYSLIQLGKTKKTKQNPQIGSLEARLHWNGFHVKEEQVTHRATCVSDPFILLLVIQMLLTLTCGVQIQGYAWDQGQCVFNSRSPTVCSAQSNQSGSNCTDCGTIARLSVLALTSCAIIHIFKWLMVGADNQAENSFKCSSSSAYSKICIMIGKSIHISSTILSAEIQQQRKLCLDWFRQLILKGLHLAEGFFRCTKAKCRKHPEAEQVEYRYLKCLKGSGFLCQFLTCKLFDKLVTEVVSSIARLLYRCLYA